jgi:hypothetical protein
MNCDTICGLPNKEGCNQPTGLSYNFDGDNNPIYHVSRYQPSLDCSTRISGMSLREPQTQALLGRAWPRTEKDENPTLPQLPSGKALVQVVQV